MPLLVLAAVVGLVAGARCWPGTSSYVVGWPEATEKASS